MTGVDGEDGEDVEDGEDDDVEDDDEENYDDQYVCRRGRTAFWTSELCTWSDQRWHRPELVELLFGRSSVPSVHQRSISHYMRGGTSCQQHCHYYLWLKPSILDSTSHKTTLIRFVFVSCGNPKRQLVHRYSTIQTDALRKNTYFESC